MDTNVLLERLVELEARIVRYKIAQQALLDKIKIYESVNQQDLIDLHNFSLKKITKYNPLCYMLPVDLAYEVEHC